MQEVRKTPDFLSKSGAFMVAEAGLELAVLHLLAFICSIKPHTLSLIPCSLALVSPLTDIKRENLREKQV